VNTRIAGVQPHHPIGALVPVCIKKLLHGRSLRYRRHDHLTGAQVKFGDDLATQLQLQCFQSVYGGRFSVDAGGMLGHRLFSCRKSAL
jgi:hypothetical protein